MTKPSINGSGNKHSVTLYSKQANANRDIPSLYSLKAICACFVLILHGGLFFITELKPLLMVAVPVFFMISGYFLYVKSRDRDSVHLVLHMLKNALFITFFVNLLYLLFDSLINQTFAYFHPRFLGLIFIKGGYGADEAYWYLIALCESLALLYLMFRHLPAKWFNALAYLLPFLFAGAAVFGSYYEIFQADTPPFIFRNNMCFVGIPCILSRYLIGKHERALCRSSRVIIALLFFTATSYLEWGVATYFYGFTANDFRFSTLPLAASLVVFCLTHKNGGPQILAHIGKWHSANMYYVHIGVRTLLYMSCASLIAIPFINNSLAIPLIVLSLMLSSILNGIYSFFKRVKNNSRP